MTNEPYGSPLIQMSFKGVGRIRRRTGTKNPKTVKQLKVMLQNLYDTGRLNILEDIKEGRITLMQVYSHWKSQSLNKVPTVSLLQPVVATVREWIDSNSGIAENTRRVYKENFNTFAKRMTLTDETTVNDLPDQLRRYRDILEREDKRRTFNYVRAIVLGFLKHTEGRDSEIYNRVLSIPSLKAARKKDGVRLSVLEVDELLKSLPTQYGDMVKAMVLTGMGWKEYAEDGFDVQDDRVIIHGQKREGRERVVPLIQREISPPTTSVKVFRRELKKVNPKVGIYDFRRTFAHWMEEAGIPRTRRKLYLGHGASDVTDLYERHEVGRFLVEDGQLLREYIETARKPQTPMKPKLAKLFLRTTL